MMIHTLLLLALTLSDPPPSQGAQPATLDLTAVRGLAVQHDGRWMPLDTLARDLVESATGQVFFDGQDPVHLLLSWTFAPQAWMDVPLIPIRNAELRGELQLPGDQKRFSYNQLLRHEPLQKLIAGLSTIEPGRKLDPLESKVSDISEQLALLKDVFRGEAIRVIPDPKNATGAWRPVRLAQVKVSSADTTSPTACWIALQQAFVAADGRAFSAAVLRLQTALHALPAAFRPDPGLIDREVQYNRLHPFRWAWVIMVLAALLSAVALKTGHRGLRIAALVTLIAGFAVLTAGLGVRWQIAGRIPASNMFESLLFLGWGTGAFAIVSMLVMRDGLAPLTASAMGACALLLADVLPLDAFIRPIAPVLLDTVWMSIHVPIIMLSYSVLALAVLIAHAQLITLALAPSKAAVIRRIETLHYWYVHVGSILLAAGIITGSMWAASSWGRYWGWDPKEVWSLVALLGYLMILHVRIPHERIPRWGYALGAVLLVIVFCIVGLAFGSPTPASIAALAATALAVAYYVIASGYFATAVKSIAAFWLILMTYVGVNYLLGTGLHSYGFGTGAMARYMLILGTADLLLIAVLWVICTLGSRWRRPVPVRVSALECV